MSPRTPLFAAVILSVPLSLTGCGGGDAPPPPAEGAPIPADSIPLPSLLPDTLTDPPHPALPPVEEDSIVAPADAVPEWEGRVEVTTLGPVPAAFLHRADQAPLQLVGPFTDELERLAGARVVVRGSGARGATSAAIHVTHYEIVEIDGHRPHVGILGEGEDAGSWVLTTEGETLRLSGLGAEPRLSPGALIWAIGTVEGESMEVTAYGILRPGS